MFVKKGSLVKYRQDQTVIYLKTEQ